MRHLIRSPPNRQQLSRTQGRKPLKRAIVRQERRCTSARPPGLGLRSVAQHLCVRPERQYRTRQNRRGLITTVCCRIKKLARSMNHQATLLLDCLARHQPYIGPHDRLANRFPLFVSFFCRLTRGLPIARQLWISAAIAARRKSRPSGKQGSGTSPESGR